MSIRFDRQAMNLLIEIISDKRYARRHTLSRKALTELLRKQGWRERFQQAEPRLAELDCAHIYELCSDTLDILSPRPEQGWLELCLSYAQDMSFPDAAFAEQRQRYGSGALFYLALCQTLFTLARSRGLIPEEHDLGLLDDEELNGSEYTVEYRRFCRAFRQDFIYEMMRLGQEITPFKTLEHISGVHQLTLSLARQFRERGGPVDCALASAAAIVHDLGKFGCKKGERVPYLHYYYTGSWCEQRQLPSIGHIAANHSAWDLELENLSAESLLLIYADFRVKQVRDKAGVEHTQHFSLAEAFDVILSKLDNVDQAKVLRYRFVYAKLRDFEQYLRFLGVNVEWEPITPQPLSEPDIALMQPDQVVDAFKRLSIRHNLALMSRFSAERLFGNILEAARSEKDWQNLRAYIGVAEEYCNYVNPAQKLQTLDFLYELLCHGEGDIRRQAGALLGSLIARFDYGYLKELPADVKAHDDHPSTQELWRKYLAQIVLPDHKLTQQHKSWIGFSLRSVVAALLDHCPEAERQAHLSELWRYYGAPEELDDFPIFVLLDTGYYLPLSDCEPEMLEQLCRFALLAADNERIEHRVAALRLLRQLAGSVPASSLTCYKDLLALAESYDTRNSSTLLFLLGRLRNALNLSDEAQQALLAEGDIVADIFLENLKTATPWIIKAVNIKLLVDQVDRGATSRLLHIAAHFSNLIKVSERIVVRHDAGAALVRIAPLLSLDQRNEIAVELAKGLEVGEYEFSKYIPSYLGEFALWLHPRELDELIGQLKGLLSSANDSVVAVALDTVAILLEHYGDYPQRFPESEAAHTGRQKYLLGILMKGLSCYRPEVRQEALLVLGRHLFGSEKLTENDQRRLFALSAKKLLFLIAENLEGGLAFFYRAAALNSIYRFITRENLLRGGFDFEAPLPIAFFPGTFDPFTLSHKGIMQEIRSLGFEVMLAVDEFSWSKNTQPHLMRRQIALQAMADRFHVHIFPDSIPVNLSNPADLCRLRSLFPDRQVYMVVGSDVVANASSYQAEPSADSIHSFDHIIFERSGAADSDAPRPECFQRIQGRILRLTLPIHLEDISSTRIRENIDQNRDISNLLDPMVQEYIYHNGLYLREPQYKPILRAGAIHFELIGPDQPQRIRDLVEEIMSPQPEAPALTDELLRRGHSLIVLRNGDKDDRAEGFISFGSLCQRDLLHELGNADLAERLRQSAAGPLLLISALYLRRPPALRDSEQLLLTEALDWGLRQECLFAMYHSPLPGPTEPAVAEVLKRQGFIRLAAHQHLWHVDMRAPLTLIQNLETTIKEPLASEEMVLRAVRQAHQKLQTTLTTLFPGELVLSMSSGVIHHRLVRKITQLNDVPPYPVTPRHTGPYMCMPFGKLLRGKAAPNTVTKTLHTDKVFDPDLRSFTIEAYPNYAPLSDQIRIIKSFMRPLIMVDDLLHKGYRLRAIIPMLEAEDIEVRAVLVGLLSGRGRDHMLEAGLNVDSIYFVPNMRGWFVESSLYPFIGGDTVRRDAMKAPGLLPSVNLILPYAAPPLHQSYSQQRAFELSFTCLTNARDIMLALESQYRLLFGRNLTLSRLAEAIIRPLCPDRGACMDLNINLAASEYLNNDIEMLLRMEKVVK